MDVVSLETNYCNNKPLKLTDPLLVQLLVIQQGYCNENRLTGFGKISFCLGNTVFLQRKYE